MLRDCADFADAEMFADFVSSVGADAVLGVHAYRAGRLLLSPRYRLPTALVLGGTDVNVNVHDIDKKRVMDSVLGRCSAIVAFSPSMLEAFCANFDRGLLHDKAALLVIPPAVMELPATDTVSPVCVALAAHSAPYLLLVTGIREVKDPCFLVSTMRARAKEKLVVVGPVLSQESFARFRELISDNPYVVYGGEVSQQVIYRLSFS